MRKSLAVLLLCIPSVLASAQSGSIVNLKTKVVGLPPGTHISIEMSARYAVEEWSMKKGGNKAAAAPAEQYSVASPDVFEWEFTVDKNGTAPAKSFNFHFPTELGVAPKGLTALMYFPTRYRITCPPGTCRSRQSEPEFGMAVVKDPPLVIPRCLQIRIISGVTIGVYDDCEDPAKKGLLAVPSK